MALGTRSYVNIAGGHQTGKKVFISNCKKNCNLQINIFAISRFAIIEKNPFNSSNFNKFLGAISAPLPIYATSCNTYFQ